ncbi:MAG: arylsulfatase [Planctomycetota bacterium]|jgi:arylsulfatase
MLPTLRSAAPILATLCLYACVTIDARLEPGRNASVTGAARPNILLIVADDLGYADLGCYGGDIATPNIDALAAEGIRLSQFHTAPYCAPTRAMLLSGNNNHVAGMARQSRSGILGHPYPGYENHLSDRIVPFPRLLREAGYHTSMAGKWHLGLERESSPTAAGFERSISLLDGAGNHWDAVGFFEGGSTFWADGDYAEWPEGRYSTDLYTDRLIEFIGQAREQGRPFLAFAAYTSPHWPLQVPDEYLDRYAGRYDQGYDRLREQRFESLKAAGIIPPDSSLPPRNPAITPWEQLDDAKRRRESRKMELYAAMVENLDHHVGRLVAALKRHGTYDDTLIVFMSDNGAAAEDFYNGSSYMHYVRGNYDNDLENMGRPGSFVSYGPQWAEAGSAPFARHKGYTREGGITAPMIVAGPGVSRHGTVERAYMTVMDLAPTFLELAGAEYPERDGIQPMLGRSMVAFLSGATDEVHDETYVTTLSHGGRALVRRGRWKLTNLDRPFDEGRLELFDLLTDPGETTDLKAAEPEIYREMLELWRAERRRLGIVVPSDL